MKTKKYNDLYFAFPDGVLDYSCSECNGLCCQDRGLTDNIINDSPRLLELYPAFASAAIGINGTIISFSTPEKCFFLDDDNFCRIEKEHGKEYKMDLCNFFPFNRLAAIGNTMAISPNFLCPIKLKLPSEPGKVKGTHKELYDIVLNSNLLDDKTAMSKFNDTETPEEYLRQEIAFRDLCQKNIGEKPFKKMLADIMGDEEEINNFITRVQKVLHIDGNQGLDNSEHIDNLLYALSPSIRLTMSMLSPESRIFALVLYEYLLRRLSTLRKESETLKSANQIYMNLGPSIRLLAMNHNPFPIPEENKEEIHLPPRLTFGPLVLAAHAALSSGRKGEATLKSLEIALDDKALTPEIRSAFLVEFGLWIEKLSYRT